MPDPDENYRVQLNVELRLSGYIESRGFTPEVAGSVFAFLWLAYAQVIWCTFTAAAGPVGTLGMTFPCASSGLDFAIDACAFERPAEFQRERYGARFGCGARSA